MGTTLLLPLLPDPLGVAVLVRDPSMDQISRKRSHCGVVGEFHIVVN